MTGFHDGVEQLPGMDLIERAWAVISEDAVYRYELGRRWTEGHLLEWVMLNPSTADGTVDDPTIRRCCGFARDWGFAGIRVTNLFAYRATDPAVLNDARLDIHGDENDDYLGREHGPITVLAWGSHRVVEQRGIGWPKLVEREGALMCLGYNKDGSPKHPLYVPKNAGLRPWPKPDPKERHY